MNRRRDPLLALIPLATVAAFGLLIGCGTSESNPTAGPSVSLPPHLQIIRRIEKGQFSLYRPWPNSVFGGDTQVFVWEMHELFRYRRAYPWLISMIESQHPLVAATALSGFTSSRIEGAITTPALERWYQQPIESWQYSGLLWEPSAGPTDRPLGTEITGFLAEELPPVYEGLDVVRPLRPIVSGGKWGLIDLKGKLIVGPCFDSIGGDFGQRLIRMKAGDKWGYLDTLGDIVIEPKYDMAFDFADGLAAVSIDGKVGFIDENGQVVIAPVFRAAHSFCEGLAAVRIDAGKPSPSEEPDQQWGFIDSSGKMVIEPVFSAAASFSDGRACVILPGQIGLYYINGGGEIVAGPFDWAGPFSVEIAGLAKVGLHQSDGPVLYGFLNTSGTFIFRPVYEALGPLQDGLAPAAVRIEGRRKHGFVDVEGSVVIPMKFDDARPFFEGLAAVCIGDKWGFVDRHGDKIVPPTFDAVGNIGFRHGMAPVSIRRPSPVDGYQMGEWGHINRAGEWVIAPQFDSAGSFDEHGIAWVGIDGALGYINRQGDYIWEPTK